jgi:excisionase family DNA binding protein
LDKIFSISEAAEYVGVFTLTLRNWEKKGLIKAFRTPGGHRRFKKNDLDKIIGRGTAEKKLKESIERLKEANVKDSRQERFNELIKELKDIFGEL